MTTQCQFVMNASEGIMKRKVYASRVQIFILIALNAQMISSVLSVIKVKYFKTATNHVELLENFVWFTTVLMYPNAKNVKKGTFWKRILHVNLVLIFLDAVIVHKLQTNVCFVTASFQLIMLNLGCILQIIMAFALILLFHFAEFLYPQTFTLVQSAKLGTIDP